MEFNLADLFENAVDHVPRPRVPGLRGQAPHLPRDGGAREPARAPPGRARRAAGRPRRHLRLQLRRVGRDAVGGLQAPRGLDQHQLPLRRGRAALPVRQRRPVGAGLPARVRAAHRAGCATALPRPALLARRSRTAATRTPPASARSTTSRRWRRARRCATSRRAPADDRYILYTGGTTGMPKGVVWRHEDVLFALGGGIDLLTGERAQQPRGHGRARQAPARRPSCRSRRSCTARRSGRSWAGASSAARSCWWRSSTRRTVWRLVEQRAGERDDDHRRRDGPAARRGARRSRTRCGRPRRSLAAVASTRGRLLAVGEGRVLPRTSRT